MPRRDKVAPSNPPLTAATIKAYAIPLFLLSVSVFYQLVVLPRSFPPSHYDALGIKRFSPVEEVNDAFEKLSSKWESSEEVPSTVEFLKTCSMVDLCSEFIVSFQIRYAYELLTNPLWKRDYDLFGIDEQLHVLEDAKAQYAEESFSHVKLPLLDPPTLVDNGDHASNEMTSQNFLSLIDNAKPWLVQVYSLGSNRCARFSSLWKEIASLLDEVANTAMVELGEAQLAMFFAERKPAGQFFFRSGLPALVAFPPGCKTSDCLMRFEGDISTDAVTDWFATTVLGLPRILYYSKESLVPNFLEKSGPHKVKVIIFSKTGERATPFIRQTAKNYSAYASFALVLWREEDFSFWWNSFEVESSPAIVFLKDPGVKPVVYHGPLENSQFLYLMEKNKQQELPQLRSVTSMELGCDPRGYSRAGNDTTSWYCVILAGRLGPELNNMRQTMRRIQVALHDDETNAADVDQSLLATTLKKNRLTFAWLDGEAQENFVASSVQFTDLSSTLGMDYSKLSCMQKFCSFYLHSETVFDTCGQRRDMHDVPRLFIVRYKRNATEDNIEVEKKPKNLFSVLEDQDLDQASQLVARYNGSDEIPQIIRWISETIRDGDTRNLPYFKTRTPDLVAEDSEAVWSKGAQHVVSKSLGLKHTINNIRNKIYDHLGDPRIGPMLLLGALISCGTIYLIRSQPTPPSQSSQQSIKEEPRPRYRERSRNAAQKERAPSMTDNEPKDAFQLLADSDSDSE
ncbi:hypothetical protein Tsubulata_009388 [Turnera subulata]|uniref:J domain-containing protein n=1 Tax=Turnera subulata TaxID=218843 RepID=A0A9Q0G0N6_9ROSI|nr:hypothetical protein Tsubulata_009388 [Turnera subulata]